MHKRSQYKTHTSLSLQMQRSFKSTASEFTKILSNSFDKHCASSPGGPGRNFGEDSGINSTFGTMYPLLGVSAFGVPSSY